MKKLFVPIGLLIFWVLCLVPNGQGQASPISQNPGTPWQLGLTYTFSSTSQPTGGFIVTGMTYFRIQWVVFGTVSGCALSVDSSAGGGGFTTGGIIAAATIGSCASSGQYVTPSATTPALQGQITPTVTGSGKVVVTIFGYTDNPSAGSSTTGNVNVTNANIPVTQSGAINTNQSLGNAGFGKVTDGTNTAAVKPASTAVGAADPSLAVGLSPNSPLPSGTNSIGNTNQSLGNAGFGKVTDGTNTAAVKAASTAVAAADPSVAVGLSPNSPLPSGTNSIGAVTSAAGTTFHANIDNNNIAASGSIPSTNSATCIGTGAATNGVQFSSGLAGSGTVLIAISGTFGAGNTISLYEQGDGANFFLAPTSASGSVSGFTTTSQQFVVNTAGLTNLAVCGPPSSGTVTVNMQASLASTHLPPGAVYALGTLTPVAAIESGVWNVRLQDTSGNGITSNSTTQSRSIDVNLVSLLGVTHSKTNPLFASLSDGTNSLTAALSAWGVAPTGTEVMAVNANLFGSGGQLGTQAAPSSTQAAEVIIVPQNAGSGINALSGVTVATLTSGTAGVNIKASSGAFYGAYVYNANASAQYFELINSAGAGTIGTELMDWEIPASTGVYVPVPAGMTISCATGIAVACDTTKAGATACASAMNVTVFYK